MMVRMGPRRALMLLSAIGVASALLHLACARERPGFGAVLSALLHVIGVGDGGDPLDLFVVTHIRLPRLLVAAFGGAALGLAGALMQAAFRNPLAAPDIVGTSAGAAFGGALAIVTGLAAQSVLAAPAASLLAALLATWLVFVLAATGARFSAAGLLLAGVALNTLIGAMTTFVVTKSFGNYSASGEVLFWLMGGLGKSTWNHAAITAAGLTLFAVLVALRVRELDVLTLSDDSAHSLGIDVARSRRWFLWLAAGLTASTVANTGGIVFVGLVVPHLARLLVGPAHLVLLPASALLGGALLVLSDFVCRNVPAHWNLPLSVVTGVIGAPYFLFLLRRHRRGEELA